MRRAMPFHHLLALYAPVRPMDCFTRQLLTSVVELHGGVLGTPIGVEHDIIRHVTSEGVRHSQGAFDKIGGLLFAEPSPDHSA